MLLSLARESLAEFTRGSLSARKVAGGLSPEKAGAYVVGKHELNAVDLRGLRKEAAALRRTWDERYRDIRHKVYAHSELVGTAELFAKTRIDELVDMLDRLEVIYENLLEAHLNGQKPGSRSRIALQFPVPAASYGHRAGEEVYRQTEAMLKRLAKPT